jgi:hypothetical protein
VVRPIACPAQGTQADEEEEHVVESVDIVHELRDIEAIKCLKARYFRLMDHKQWDQWGMVFSSDARLVVPEGGMDVHGRAAIVEAVSGALDGVRTVHHGHMPEIEITGPDSARGTWAMFDYVEFPRDPDGNRVGLEGYGHYTEEYARDGDEWRISRLHLSRLRIDPLAGGLPSAHLGADAGTAS